MYTVAILENKPNIRKLVMMTLGDKKFKYFGHSSVIDPWGRTVIEGKTDETLLTCEIDLSLVKEVRENFPILKDFQRVKI